MDEGPRFPRVPARAGHYESFYLKACQPGGGRGVWIRHTVHKRPGAEPTASIWLVFFDREADSPQAAKLTLPARELSVPPGGWIKVGPAEIGPGHARCGVPLTRIAEEGNAAERESGLSAASWDLTFSGVAAPCRYLPAEWLYRAPLPRTKFIAPVPDARFDGNLELAGGRAIDVAGWQGMVGHNWGSEHAERWIWVEGAGLDGDPGAYLDVGAARVKLGPRASPWIAAGMLALDGETHRLGGLAAARSTKVEEAPTACSFFLPGRDIVVHGRIAAPEKDFVGWVYADPRGPEHNTVNCSVADLELTIERPGRPARQLTLAAAGAYELGMRESDHGIPIQPYPDG
jgi:hypothetical protein